MNIAILGCGQMGKAISFDLIQHGFFNTIYLVDSSQSRVNDLVKFLNDPCIQQNCFDVGNTDDVKNLFSKVDIVISALPYFFNERLTKLAIEMGRHFIDLGGNNDVVSRQRALHDQAQQSKSIVIPDCGLAPGLVSIITKDIIESMDTVDEVHLRVGGLPVNPQPPLNYQQVFSINGLLNEYIEDTLVLHKGNIITKPSLTEVESLEFSEPFGTMEAFLTSGGCSTLPYTYKEKIKNLDYKTIRYPGHCMLMNYLKDLGFLSEETIQINTCSITKRSIFENILCDHLPKKGKDVVLLKAWGLGKKAGRTIERRYSMVDYCDEDHNMTAMMRTTGFPVSIIAQMIKTQEIRTPGVFCCEEIIPCQPFFTNVQERNIALDIMEVTPS